ncbi:hypothetical protein PIB30_001905 [Stylosanthes scabra]|uniref:Zinc finger GRF-type domain-containing protein n=1 Tax=Stylosanthes scabra TaxID=79078 RepID=A0ABU6X0Y6_9FABA|nr:hypothetical protein [Stylosanthes scabra]
MESEWVCSGGRRSAGGGGGRSDRSSSSTQGVFAASMGDDRYGVAPIYHCGVYAILYLSKTAKNPDRLFFGCPFFKKAEIRHCKHIDQLRRDGIVKCQEDIEDVDEDFAMLEVENRVTELEDRLAAMEKKKKNPICWIIVGLLALILAMYAVVYIQG